MTKIFNGKGVAKKINKETKKQVQGLKKNVGVPRLVSILIGDNPASEMFLLLKKQVADDVGAQMQIVQFDNKVTLKTILDAIEVFNNDEDTHGVMVQLPLPDSFSSDDRNQIINAINAKKDVDGLQENSKFVAPVVLAVETALKESKVGKK